MAGKSKKDSQNEQLTLSDVDTLHSDIADTKSAKSSGAGKSVSKKTQGEMLADIPESLADLSASNVSEKHSTQKKTKGKSSVSALSGQDEKPNQIEEPDKASVVEDGKEKDETEAADTLLKDKKSDKKEKSKKELKPVKKSHEKVEEEKALEVKTIAVKKSKGKKSEDVVQEEREVSFESNFVLEMEKIDEQKEKKEEDKKQKKAKKPKVKTSKKRRNLHKDIKAANKDLSLIHI